ncbi:preprotein translocase subunit YajC [Georgenia sp. SUBG003]|uniref:preprotein translocase subunit YajC n=1 Tax=Georgenia sp. SUBG003 TaxID=1497974 RepID=UPI0006932E8D
MDPTIIIFLALMIGMMWFVTSRGKKQAAAQRDMLAKAVVPGASVMTIGGFFGRVVDVDGDVVTLESPSGVETIWLRSAIKEVKEPPFAVVEDDEDAAGTSAVVPDDASALDPGAGGGTQFRPGGPEVDGSGRLTRDDESGEPGTTPRA